MALTVDADIDGKTFRQVLGHYPTGVCVVTTTEAGGEKTGIAVGSFTSVSLVPPLVAFFPDKGSSTWPRIERAGKFCVNVLAEDQTDVCRSFATRGVDKFEGISHRVSENGSPVIDDVIAWIDCSLHAVHEAGDHYIVLGRVHDLGIGRAAPPLLFFRGGYGTFSELALT